MPTPTPTELMPIAEILKQLKRLTPGVFPRAALKQAIAQKEAITPALLEILADAAQNLKKIAKDTDYMAHLYAMFLLAQFREKQAYPLIVNFFATPGDLATEVTGELVTEDLARILASVCGGDVTLIERLVEDGAVDEYVRGSALEALVALVVHGLRTREEVLAYFQALFRGKLERKLSDTWATLVLCAADLHLPELQEDIRQAFAEELVDEFIVKESWVHQRLATGREKVLRELQENPHYALVDNVVKEMEWWDCFVPVSAKQSSPLPKPLMPSPSLTPKPAPKPFTPPPPQKGVAKIGRNVPCPCGSGKKYKMCCGQER